MKKLFLLLGVFASITLMLASCSKSPEQKAKDLPDNLRSVFLLRMQDVKFCDISKQLNISINTATSRYQYAVRHLREMCASVM